jgi:hypothetical protein
MTTNGAWIKQEDGTRKPGLVREPAKPTKKQAPKKKREE